MILRIKENVALAPYTTLGIGGNAAYFADIDSLTKLREALLWARKAGVSVTVLGGGSNVLIADAGVNGLVIRLLINDIYIKQSGSRYFVTVGAGKNLDELIGELVEEGVWGLENLSAIPGSVGAVPIQNVGAYGVEASDCVASVVAYDPEENSFKVFAQGACSFAYRDSFFKTEAGKKYIIVWVTFALSSEARPLLSYHDLERYFKDRENPTLAEIRSAIISIRSKKFPDWKVLGTAGSFFKNPILTREAYASLLARCPGIPGFTLDDDTVKVPLGFILDRILGLKGYREGNVGLYRDQALVLINHGGANAKEIKMFAEKIATLVREKTGITIEREVTDLH